MLLMALALPVLISGAGFAVDTAQWYMWKREMQHSVDQAALAGAWALLKGESGDTYKTWAQNQYDVNQDKTKSFDSGLSLQLADYAGGSNNSVIASASASKRLPFSGYLLGAAATVQVRAQASYAPGGTANACLVSTATDGVGTEIGNNATVKAQCGLAAMSCDKNSVDGDNALDIADNANVTTGAIYACGSVQVPDALKSVAKGDLGPNVLSDPYKDLQDKPDPDNPTPRTYKCANLGGGDKQASLLPGTYTGGISVQCTTTCSPGIYVIDGGTLDLAGNYDVTCNGVMFVLKNGALIKFTGNGGNGSDTSPTNTINLTPMTAAQVAEAGYPDLADRYAGMLIYEDKNNNPGNPGHKFAGNANSVIEGTIYLPSGEITVIGTANVKSECLEISAYRIHIAGGADLETFCPTDSSIVVGSANDSVKLVA